MDPNPVIGVSLYASFNNSPLKMRDPFGDTALYADKYEVPTQLGYLKNIATSDVQRIKLLEVWSR